MRYLQIFGELIAGYTHMPRFQVVARATSVGDVHSKGLTRTTHGSLFQMFHGWCPGKYIKGTTVMQLKPRLYNVVRL